MLVFSISVNVHSKDEMHSQTDMKDSHMEHLLHKASHHAPIGIMGGEYHKKGEFMFSINRKRVSMKDNSSNGKQLSDYKIISLPATTLNSFMYRLTDWHNIIFAKSFVSKSIGRSCAPVARMTSFVLILCINFLAN